LLVYYQKTSVKKASGPTYFLPRDRSTCEKYTKSLNP
jgi:hypothetical protein